MSGKSRDLIGMLVVFIVLIGVVVVLMSGLGGGHRSGMMGMIGFGGGFMVLIPIAFVVLIVLGAYYLIAQSSGTGRSGSEERPLEILRKRYANGQITTEQFLKMKKELES